MAFPSYSSANSFLETNKEKFSQVGGSTSLLQDSRKMSESGDPLTVAEDLAFIFLKLANVCGDLKIGLSRSALNAKANQKKVEGLIYRSFEGESVAARSKYVLADDRYVEAVKAQNDLEDLLDYLNIKYDNLMANYYYYRGFNKR